MNCSCKCSYSLVFYACLRKCIYRLPNDKYSDWVLVDSSRESESLFYHTYLVCDIRYIEVFGCLVLLYLSRFESTDLIRNSGLRDRYYIYSLFRYYIYSLSYQLTFNGF